MIEVKFQKVHPEAILPKYQTEGSSGFDLSCVESILFLAGETKVVPIGWKVEIPSGYEMQIRPRSGFSLKTPFRVANTPGTIDSDYRGEIGILLQNNSGYTTLINKGDRIAQGVVVPVLQVGLVEVDDLSTTQRGEGGFGSTGVKS